MHRSDVDCKALTSDRMSTKFAMLNPGAKRNLRAPPLHVEAIPVKAAKLADLKGLLRYSICQPIHRHTWPPYSRARKRKMYLWIAMSRTCSKYIKHGPDMCTCIIPLPPRSFIQPNKGPSPRTTEQRPKSKVPYSLAPGTCPPQRCTNRTIG